MGMCVCLYRNTIAGIPAIPDATRAGMDATQGRFKRGHDWGLAVKEQKEGRN